MTDNARGGGESKRPASNVDAALDLARRGFQVFPIRRGGVEPQIERWPERATTDEATIHEWWAEWPNANVGVATALSR